VPEVAAPMADRRRQRGRRRRLLLVLACIFWVITSALAVVAVMRIVAWDTYQPFAVLNDLTAFIYLPAWIIAVVAAIYRRPLLAGAALLVVVAQVVFMVPELSAAEPVPAWAAHAPSFRMVDGNVYDGNPSMTGYARQIDQVRPQLVTLEEATPPDVLELQIDGALAHLPYRLQIKRFDPWAFLVASRYPITHEHVVYEYGTPLIVQVTLGLPSGPQEVWVVHTVAPAPGAFSQWRGQLAVIDRLLRARGPAGLLLVGDFNATWGSEGFRQILDAGLTDGAAARGEPFAMTWSQIEPVVPPLVRIDHILTGPGLAVTQIRTDVGLGSDHRDLIATVATERRSRA